MHAKNRTEIVWDRIWLLAGIARVLSRRSHLQSGDLLLLHEDNLLAAHPEIRAPLQHILRPSVSVIAHHDSQGKLTPIPVPDRGTIEVSEAGHGSRSCQGKDKEACLVSRLPLALSFEDVPGLPYCVDRRRVAKGVQLSAKASWFTRSRTSEIADDVNNAHTSCRTPLLTFVCGAKSEKRNCEE